MRELNENEKKWIELICNVEIEYIEVIKKQFTNVKVEEEKGVDFFSLVFFVKKDVERYPCNIRVPIEMRIFHPNVAPIVFLLHIKKGFIHELEIFTADASELKIDDISFETIEYVTDDKEEVIHELDKMD